MRKMKGKIAIASALCALAVGVSALCATVFAEATPTYTGSVAEGTQMLAEAKSAQTLSARASALLSLSEYELTVNPAEDGYAELIAMNDAEYADFIADYADGYSESASLPAKSTYAKKLRMYAAQLCPADDTAGYAETTQKIDGITAQVESELKAERAKLESKAGLDEYGLKTLWKNDFEGGSAQALKVSNTTSGNLTANVGIVKGDDGNSYYRLDHNIPTHLHASMNIEDATEDIVVEFDITTHGKLPTTAIVVERGSYTWSDGTKTSPVLFKITPAGALEVGSVLLNDVIVKGEWTHFAIYFNIRTAEVKYFVDYSLVATVDMSRNGESFNLNHFRFGVNYNNSTNPRGEYSLDNMTMYQGTALRTEGYLETLTSEELFKLCVEQYVSVDMNVNKRIVAYNRAAQLLPQFYDEQNGVWLTDSTAVRELVASLLGTPVDGVIEQAKELNYTELEKLVDKLNGIKRAEDSYSSRLTAIEKVQSFMTDNTTYLPSDGRLDAISALLDAKRAELTEEDRLAEFCDAVSNYYSSSSVEQVTASFAKANEMYESGLPEELLGDAFPEFTKAYEDHKGGEEYVNDMVTVTNTERFVAMVGYLNNFPTVEQMEANYDGLVFYFNSCYNIYKTGLYDEYMEGCAEAVKLFGKFMDFFLGRKNGEDLEYIKERLERAEASNRYMEKLGICLQLKEYVIQNEVDTSIEQIAQMMARVDALLEELEGLEDDGYGEIIAENTETFMALAEQIKAESSVLAKMELCDRATVVSFLVDETREDVREALAQIAELKAQLDALEERTQAYLEAVGMLKAYTLMKIADRENRIFAQLCVCVSLSEGIRTEGDDVTSAKAVYNSIYNDFVGYLDAVSAEVLAINGAVICINGYEEG